MFTLATKFRPEPTAFARTEQAGFGGAEFWLDASVLAGWQEVAHQAGAYPLRYALHFPNKPEQSQETLDHTAALYRALSCSAVVLHQPLADRYAGALLERSPGMRLAVENHRLTPEELENWARSNPGLALDIEHLWLFTYRDASLDALLAHVKGFLSRWGEKVRHVHMPGYLPGQAEHRPMYCSRDLVLGTFSLLEEAGFTDLVVSEVNAPFQNDHDLRMDVLLFDYWRQRLAKLKR